MGEDGLELNDLKSAADQLKIAINKNPKGKLRRV
jgi:hypothetical protein